METHSGTGVGRVESLAHQARVHAPRCAKLRNLFEEVVVRRKEKGQPRRKSIHLKSSFDRALHVFHRIGEREGKLLNRGRTCFADVVSRNGNRIPSWDLRGTESEDISDQP